MATSWKNLFFPSYNKFHFFLNFFSAPPFAGGQQYAPDAYLFLFQTPRVDGVLFFLVAVLNRQIYFVLFFYFSICIIRWSFFCLRSTTTENQSGAISCFSLASDDDDDWDNDGRRPSRGCRRTRSQTWKIFFPLNFKREKRKVWWWWWRQCLTRLVMSLAGE
jgi:hypothetical protein